MTDDLTITVPGEDVVEQDDRPLIDPETGWHRLMVEQMARSIVAAHEVNAKSWAIQPWIGQPILSVSFLNVISVGPKQPFGLIVDNSVLDESARDLAASRLDEAKQYDDEQSWVSYLRLPPDEIIHLLEELGPSHIAAVRRCAGQVRTHAHRWKEHHDEFRHHVERISGHTIPEPGYFEKLRELQPSGSAPASRFWKISPGPNATYWIQFRNKSVIAVHWLDEPRDLRSLPMDRPEFVKTINAYPDATSKTANALWEFGHDIKPGDRVLAYGDRTVLGSGEITGDYESVQDDFPYHHRRAVKWESVIPMPTTNLSDSTQRKLARNATVVELSEAEFNEAIGRPIQFLTTVKQAIQRHFIADGLSYTDAQIATFYTALQTKGFVVLSGISGTGKSKIAQGFVNIMPDKDIPPEEVVAEREQLIPRVVQTTTINSALVNFPRKLIERYPLPEPGTKTYVMVTFDGLSQACAFNTIVQGNSAVYCLYFSGDLRQRITSLDLGTMLYFRATIDNDMASLIGFDIELRKDIASTHGSDVTGSAKESNHLFLSVRPDWRDSTSLLGYFNPLTQTYEWTDFLRFILRAAESYRARDGLA